MSNFTVKQIKAVLSANGLPTENLDAAANELCSRHKTSLDAIIEERDSFKDKAKQYDDVKKELDELKKNPSEDWKAKHDAVKKEYDDYKADLANKEVLGTKKAAFAKIAKSKGITDEKLIALITNNYDFSKEELDGDKLKNEKTIGDFLTTEYSGFIAKDGKEGASVERPPVNTGGSKTKEEILAIKDGHERRKAMAENPELFGIKE